MTTDSNSPTVVRPYVVGLSGGIGSGKTTVSNMFADLGAEIIDADVISRQLLQPGAKALAAVEEHFGSELIVNGELNRAKLREIVFSDSAAKQWLQDLLHPLIRSEILNKLEHTKSKWVVLSAPLLLESEAYSFVDTILIIDTPETLQIERTKTRDKISAHDVENIMAAQMSREDRLMYADNIIYNDTDLANLQRQTSALFSQYENDARERNKSS